jgi:integrase
MMARDIQRLTARKVETAKAGRYADGEGLYLVVDATGGRRWVFLFRWAGKLKEMGLGGVKARGGKPAVSLAKARERAATARRIVAEGRNPIVEGLPVDKAIPTFGEAADSLVESLGPQWRNAKHRAQWTMTLTRYARPLRSLPVDRVDTEAVLKVLNPVWQAKPETASRLRGRIERVLDAAKAKGERQGENPARWRGHLDHLLPTRQRLTRGHHAAMPYPELPAFLIALRDREAVAALGLEFLILTAARSGEALGAKWAEIDLEAKTWTVPAERMKAARAHRVPLSARALEILETVKQLDNGGYLFPGQKKGRPMSGMAFEMLLRRMGEDVTPHGFRSSFRDWAGEVSTFPREIAEQALAHKVGDATELAYRRGDALERRRVMMDAWAAYCEAHPAGSTVVPMKRAASNDIA